MKDRASMSDKDSDDGLSKDSDEGSEESDRFE